MAYVLTTFFVMGFGYYVAETALGARRCPACSWAWLGFWLGVVGTVMAVAHRVRRPRHGALTPSIRR